MNGVPDMGSDLVSVAIRTAIIYLVVVFGLRLGGKREIGQLTLPDLVVLLIVSNAVQNAMVGQNVTLLGGVVSAAVVLALARLLEYVADRSPRASAILVGEPRIIIRDGTKLEGALKQEEITDAELAAALREHGIEDPADVRLAVLEVDGSISVIPWSSEEGGVATTDGRNTRRAGRIMERRVGRRGRRPPFAGQPADRGG